MRQLPAAWMFRAVGDVFRIEYGAALPAARRNGGRVPVYGSSGIVGWHDQALVSAAALIVGRKGNAGACHVSLSPSWPIDTTYFIRMPHGLDPKFIGWQLELATMRGLDSSTAVPSLRRPDLERQVLYIAPLLEQRRIVAAIEEHLSRLDAAERALRAAETRLRLWSEERLLSMLRNAPSEDASLGEVCPVFVDCPHRTPHYSAAGAPALRPRDIVGGVLRLEAAARVDEAEFRLQTERRIPAPGDIVYSRELSYGWAVVVPDVTALCLSQGMVLFRPNSRISSEFLAVVLNSRVGRSQAVAAATGSAHPHINLRDIRAYRIPVPPRELQETILAEIDSRRDAASALETAIRMSRQRAAVLRRSILVRAFRGELVPQNPNDEPASVLLERIAAERGAAPKPTLKRKEKTSA